MPHELIGFCGRAGAGKGEAAQYLITQYNYRPNKFAGPLKDMLRILGLTEDEIEGNLKQSPCALLGGKTPRWAMQTLGTEWGRNLIDPDVWTRAWINRLMGLGKGGVVADDVRFQNEADTLRAAGGTLVEIRRDGALLIVGHESERQPLTPDIIIYNNGTLDALYRSIEYTLTWPP